MKLKAQGALNYLDQYVQARLIVLQNLQAESDLNLAYKASQEVVNFNELFKHFSLIQSDIESYKP